LSEGQSEYLNAFLRFCPQAYKLRALALRFRGLLRWRKADRLFGWIETAVVSRFRSVAQFAKTLHRNLEAVRFAIATPWSNGPLEGHINRLKMIKRQMYGRAGFELLKARVLPFEPVVSS
jgi:transposase